jgi:hypothetical protein
LVKMHRVALQQQLFFFSVNVTHSRCTSITLAQGLR